MKLEVHRQTTFVEDVCPILMRSTIKGERVVVYVLRRSDADLYAMHLNEIAPEVPCTIYHSAKSKTKRRESLSLFVEKKVSVIIATSSLSAQKIEAIQVDEIADFICV